MAIVQRISISVIPQDIPVIVPINQNDEGEERIIVDLFKDGVEYEPQNATVKIQGTKSNGVGFQHNATLSGNTVTADLVTDMSDVAGDVRTQILILDSNGQTGTSVFILRVQPESYISDV